MAFRLLDMCPQYRDDEGNIVASGTLYFYDNLTTTPKNATNGSGGASIGSSVTLDASGRPESDKDPWLSGVSRVRLYDADAVLVWSRDYVQEAATGGITALDPADGTEDQIYSTDGVTASWRSISEVPSQTGHAGKVLGTDGTVATWRAEQTLPTYDASNLPGGITQTATRLVIGTLAFLTGSGTAPNTGTLKSTLSVTFATAFSGTPTHVSITPLSASSTGEGAGVSSQATGVSSTGFTANFFAGAEDNGGVAEINSTIAFTFMAVGPA